MQYRTIIIPRPAVAVNSHVTGTTERGLEMKRASINVHLSTSVRDAFVATCERENLRIVDVCKACMDDCVAAGRLPPLIKRGCDAPKPANIYIGNFVSKSFVAICEWEGVYWKDAIRQLIADCVNGRIEVKNHFGAVKITIKNAPPTDQS